ncbi:hypothetical protein [Ornithinimicrobium cryptoxanthini]|nr:hypothetical protein [Ornithinimicrobium cryptoxanthini]
MVDRPSLMSFVLGRFEEDFRLVMANIPLLVEDDRLGPILR